MNICLNDSNKCDLFVSIFQHIGKFTEHMNLMFESDRFYIQSMNSSHVVIFEIILPKEWFDTYTIQGSNLVLGVSTNLFYKVLKKREKNQKIVMYSDNLVGDKNVVEKLHFNFTGEDKMIFDKEFEIPLIELESDLLSIPIIEYQAEFSLCTDKFAGLVSQLKDFGDSLEIDCSEEEIRLCACSSEYGKMMTKIPIDDLDEFAIEEGENIHMEFGLKYLYDICSYQKICKSVELKISSEFPMMVVYRIGNDTDGKMVFYIAPKVSE